MRTINKMNSILDIMTQKIKKWMGDDKARPINVIESKEDVPAPQQIRDGYDTQIGLFSSTLPFEYDIRLIRALRATIPILDIIPKKYNALMGDFSIRCDNDKASKFLNSVKANIRVNNFGMSFGQFQYQMIDSAIAYGMAIGEARLLKSLTGIYGLVVGNAERIRFVEKDGRLVLGQIDELGLNAIPFENSDLIYYYAPDQRNGHPQGYSLYHSIPFVAQIMERMLKSIDNTVCRIGDPTFFITFTGPDGETDPKKIDAAASAIQGQVTSAMKYRRRGQVKDIYGGLPFGSQLEVKILGDGGEKIISAMRFSYMDILDQIISASELPAWMLGFHRGTTERMSDNESDMIVNKIVFMRNSFTPIAERFFKTVAILGGYYDAAIDIVWDEVNLRDEKAQSEARVNNASAEKTELENLIIKIDLGLIGSIEEAREIMLSKKLIRSKITEDQWREMLTQKMLRRING